MLLTIYSIPSYRVVLENSSSKRDKAILLAFQRDRYQDKWFSEQNLKLVRIIDLEEPNLTDTELKNLILSSR